jgi:hypothetical protein
VGGLITITESVSCLKVEGYASLARVQPATEEYAFALRRACPRYGLPQPISLDTQDGLQRYWQPFPIYDMPSSLVSRVGSGSPIYLAFPQCVSWV